MTGVLLFNVRFSRVTFGLMEDTGLVIYITHKDAGLYLYHNLPILQMHNNISYQIGRTDTDTDIHSWLYQLE